jgi:SAM-dependent methyltransferase
VAEPFSFLKRIFSPRSRPPQSTDLAEYILDFSSQTPDQKNYATTHLGRLVRTLEIIPPGTKQDKILEMGAYMQITPALSDVLGYGEVRGCYLGPLGKTDQKSVTSVSGRKFQCEIDLFNAEKDRYPYPDSTIATVLCCELFEHLSEDPMYLLAEVNRILRPGGHLVLSTPNIASVRSVAAAIQGNHPGLYQQFMRPRDGGVDPRHAREYTPSEMKRAFEAAGFQVELLETGPYGPETPQGYEWAEKLLKDQNLGTELRGDTIHIVGKKTGPVVDRFPNWLYD